MKKKKANKIPVIICLIHSSLVVAVFFFIQSSMSNSNLGYLKAECLMGWNLFMAVDFPSGLLMGPLEIWIGSILPNHPNNLWDNIFFASGFFILGGIQYYILTKLFLNYLIKRKLRKPISADTNQ